MSLLVIITIVYYVYLLVPGKVFTFEENLNPVFEINPVFELQNLSGSLVNKENPIIPSPHEEETSLLISLTSKKVAANRTNVKKSVNSNPYRQSNGWNFGIHPNDRLSILPDRDIEYPVYDGWFNNLDNPYFGTAGSNLWRQTPSHFLDESNPYEMPFMIEDSVMPNPYLISSKLFAKNKTRKLSHESINNESRKLSKAGTNLSVIFVAFTMHLLNEIMNAREPACPREMIKVLVPPNDSMLSMLVTENDKYTLYKRVSYDPSSGLSINYPRIPINKVTSYIDGGSIYGRNRIWTQYLRSYQNGQLRHRIIPSSNTKSIDSANLINQYPPLNTDGIPMRNPLAPINPSRLSYTRLMVFGDDRTNESPLVNSLGIIWLRWHNYLAKLISTRHPEWRDERIFNEARKWLIATYQNIAMYEWLPTMLNSTLDETSKYSGYKSHLNAAVSVEFEALASQYYLTLVPSTLYLSKLNECNNTRPPQTDFRIRLCNNYWSPETYCDTENKTADEIILGMSRQRAETGDSQIVDDMRNFYYGTSNGLTRSDNIVQNLLHAMDVGISKNFNIVRQAFDLPVYDNFSHFQQTNGLDDEVVKSLNELYKNDIAKLDAFTGGMLESNGSPGSLFSTIILQEFLKIRDSDRFWFENEQNGLFTNAEIKVIKSISFKDVISSVTNIPPKYLGNNVFRFNEYEEETTCRIYDSILDTEEEECHPIRLLDYFEGSQTSFIVTFSSIISFIGIVFLVMLLWTKYKEKMALEHMECTPSIKCRESNITAEEWMKNDKFCPVVICFNPEQLTLNIYGERKVPYSRAIKFRLLRRAEIFYTNKVMSKPYLLLFKIPDEYDHVFRFNEEVSFDNFKYEVEQFLEFAGVNVKTYEVQNRSDLFAISFTKKYREKQLDRFFKTAFEMALSENFDDIDSVRNSDSNCSNQYWNWLNCFLNPREPQEKEDKTIIKIKLMENTAKLNKVDSCELSRFEFCEALSLKEGSHFVGYLFNHVDKDGNGKISFKEFLDFVLIFSKGSAEEKARVIFDMYDVNKNGYLSKDSFIHMLESFTELSNVKLNRQDLSQGLENMFERATLKNKKLSFEAFLELMGDHRKNMEELHINWEGIKVCIPKNKRKRREFKDNAKPRNRRTLIKGDRDKKHSTGHGGCDAKTYSQNYPKTNESVADEQLSNSSFEQKIEDEEKILEEFFGRGNNSENMSQLLGKLKFEETCDDLDITSNLPKSLNRNRKPPTAPIFFQRASSPENPKKKRRLKIKTYLVPPPTSKTSRFVFWTIRSLENYRWHIFWITLYTLTVIGIFLNKAMEYAFEKEHTGLRRVVGYGGALSRGSASALMFCYSTILLTMCRNIITFCRETFLTHFIPFDAAVMMHKYIATLGLLFTCTHVFGHAINFYHLSTQSPEDLLCMARSFYHLSDHTPKFHNWLYGTITGITGILLIVVMTFMYVFAFQRSRRYLFNMFWRTHNLYIVFYFLTFIHGLGMMLQMSSFYLFFLGPMVLFAIDKLISLARKKAEIPIVRANVLPSNVTNLMFKKPLNFEYKSGQYVRIALTSQGSNEYHPFTLTSAPHEEFLSLHIRAVGPWTNNLRRSYDKNFLNIIPSPKILLDGPFGEGHQDWNRFQVSVLIGGGIGVTPFASILKDIVYKSRSGTKMKCQKVYFLWITRTQKQFEWLTDLIRDVEERDYNNFVSVNIFITQLHHKFDIRTAMLYICERHFYKINDRSLFTGLKAITHFGRPDFVSFLMSLQDEHPEIYKFGVFSCGPPAMTNDVEKATQEMNKLDNSAFIHHFENF